MNDLNSADGILAWEELSDRVDLLVEGELSGDERSELIQQLDAQPEFWRRCALAFVERSVLSQTLGQISRQAELATIGQLRPAAQPQADRLSHFPAIRSNRLAELAGVAVCLLILVAAGFQFGVARGRAMSMSLANVERLPPSHDGAAPVGPENINNQLWLQARSAVQRLSVTDSEVVALVQVSTGDSQIEIVPIIHSKSLADQVRVLPRPQISPAIADRVERAGWRLDTSRQFLSFHLPDGENRILPVDTVNYRFVGYEVF